jgi:hypothetical protein
MIPDDFRFNRESCDTAFMCTCFRGHVKMFLNHERGVIDWLVGDYQGSEYVISIFWETIGDAMLNDSDAGISEGGIKKIW